jgi:uncharacterized protein (UPF0371 family)
MKIGFDNDKYLKEQSAAILSRIDSSFEKLYLEFGGKLLYDYHAARVLPGFNPNVKMTLLQQLKDKVEVIICIFAGHIEHKKIRADFGITYDTDILKSIDNFNQWGVKVNSVVITRFEEQPAAITFKNKLERRQIRVYTHRYTQGYPTDVDTIVSERGYGANPYLKTQKPIVVVTGPGPNSGKLATCLSQLYHEHRKGVNAGYAKFETFPIWNLPLKHPVNVAYEAATADLKDVNLIDHFHLDAYNEKAINYNRDIEAFPLLKRIIEKITQVSSFYKSPTDMGVNRAGFAIIDDEVVRQAATQEIIRRYLQYSCEFTTGLIGKETVERAELLMNEINASIDDRRTVKPARAAAEEARRQGKGNEGIYCGSAIELKDGTIITGKNSPLMHSASSLILNATKHLAQIPDNIFLLPPNIITSLKYLKKDILNGRMVSLDLEEILIALSISAAANPVAQIAVEKLKDLQECEVHLSHIPSPGDAAGLRKLGVNFTSDPEFPTKDLYMS